MRRHMRSTKRGDAQEPPEEFPRKNGDQSAQNEARCHRSVAHWGAECVEVTDLVEYSKEQPEEGDDQDDYYYKMDERLASFLCTCFPTQVLATSCGPAVPPSACLSLAPSSCQRFGLPREASSPTAATNACESGGASFSSQMPARRRRRRCKTASSWCLSPVF